MVKCTSVILIAFLATAASAAIPPEKAQQLYERTSPSLVAVQYVFQNELGRRELTGPGIVVSDDGLIMAPLLMFNTQIPDKQMTDFKIIVPREDGDPQELDAVFQGRDERTNMAFLKPKESSHEWKPIHFQEQEVKIGEPILSVGMLPKQANYKPYFMQGGVAAQLRGEMPQVLVYGGGLASVGAPVFDASMNAIGVVSFGPGQAILLDDPRGDLPSVNNPPKFFTPARDFLLSLKDPPSPDHAIELPWMGVSQMTGVSKEVAEVMGLNNQPAIQIGDVIPDAPADKAGLKAGDIIVKIDGKPLERGDEANELPAILQRRLLRRKPGDTITLSVLREKDQPLKQIEITLGNQPKRPNQAKRFYAEDLGFVVRELVFQDKYQLKMTNDQTGVLVDLLRPQAAAQTGGLRPHDVITKLDNEPVTDIDQFQKAYDDIRKQKPKEAIVLEVRRGDREDTVRIEPPQ